MTAESMHSKTDFLCLKVKFEMIKDLPLTLLFSEGKKNNLDRYSTQTVYDCMSSV